MNAEAINVEYKSTVLHEQISTLMLISILISTRLANQKYDNEMITNTKYAAIRTAVYINTYIRFMLLFTRKCTHWNMLNYKR